MTSAAERPSRRKKAAQPSDDIEFFYDVEQRSETWMKLRLGIPTASMFHVVMAEGKDGDESMSRQTYMDHLAGEIITGRTSEKFASAAMERGVRMEPIAREHYFRSRFEQPKLVGFARRKLPSGRWIGCSPDSQVGDLPKGLEIKSVAAHLMVRLGDQAAGGFPPRHKWQLLGTMLVTGWTEMDLLLYCDADDPVYAEFNVPRNEAEIKRLHDALEVFDYDLQQLVRKTRERYGK